MNLTEKIGQRFITSSRVSGSAILLFLQAIPHLSCAWAKRREVAKQMFLCGIGGFPVTALTAIFTGMVLALQSGIELSRYNQQENIGILVAAAMVREMGPVMTAIILAGLIGSSMAAELGTMSVSEEIDALEVMSINPVRFLVMPRILALTVMCPTLTIFTNLIGIAGGAVIGQSLLGVDYHIYYDKARFALELKDIYSGLFKSTVFGALIATIATSEGLRTTNGAEGVGRATMRTVVLSFLFILIFDYFLTWIFY
ncbi:MAG: ABC transporter permease [Planctomycetota bacterium]